MHQERRQDPESELEGPQPEPSPPVRGLCPGNRDVAFGAFEVVEVVLYDIEGLRYEEIARILGVARGTVRSRMQRARQALQSELISHSARGA